MRTINESAEKVNKAAKALSVLEWLVDSVGNQRRVLPGETTWIGGTLFDCTESMAIPSGAPAADGRRKCPCNVRKGVGLARSI